jgi:hypothetical protein
VGLISALKNFQTVMQVVFSDVFETCLESFIDNLEGVFRPMEVVSADFLKYSVELTLRKFFRVVKSVKNTALTEQSLDNPQKCAIFITDLFDKLADNLSDHPSMAKKEAYFRFQISRRSELALPTKPNTPTPKAEKAAVRLNSPANAEEPKKAVTAKPCVGHLGNQLGALKKNGRPYSCSFVKDRTFRYISVVGKTDQRLTDLTSAMPEPAKTDIRKAIQHRK